MELGAGHPFAGLDQDLCDIGFRVNIRLVVPLWRRVIFQMAVR